MRFRADSEYHADVICNRGGCVSDGAEHGHAVSADEGRTAYLDNTEPAGDVRGERRERQA